MVCYDSNLKKLVTAKVLVIRQPVLQKNSLRCTMCSVFDVQFTENCAADIILLNLIKHYCIFHAIEFFIYECSFCSFHNTPNNKLPNKYLLVKILEHAFTRHLSEDETTFLNVNDWKKVHNVGATESNAPVCGKT